MVVLAFNLVDRLALGILLQDIKIDLSLSDTQLGLLTGIAFALFYSILGIPIARWADRGNRVTIISVTTALWSVAVALCGLAGNFVQLLMIRVGVAVGEAGCLPPAHSLIADYFSRAERPRAVSRYMLGSSLSLIVGYFIAGWLNEWYGWRVTFVILGLPGIALAILAKATLREPRAHTDDRSPRPGASDQLTSPRQAEDVQPTQPRIKEVCRVLWRNHTFRHLLFCFAVWQFFGYGILQWQPAYFIRSHGLQTGQLGALFATFYGLGGLLGTFLGGELAARWAANNERLQLRAMAIANLSFGAISAAIYLAPTIHLAFTFLAIAAVGGAVVHGPLFATVQTLVPPQMRAMSIAIMFLFANLIGMGLGPLAAGMLSDFFRAWAGEESLRYSLLALCPGYALVAWHLWHASSTVARDLKAVQAADARVAGLQESSHG
jgi:MFS transporter, Spinster family, sphingosine-1-phosphate transporter